jgi:hypothetical protein
MFLTYCQEKQSNGVWPRPYNIMVPGSRSFVSGIKIPVLVQKYGFFGTNLKIIVYDFKKLGHKIENSKSLILLK